MSAALSPEQTLPRFVAELLAVGGEASGWLTVDQALPYLPMDRKKAYRQCQAYLARIERERRRRRSQLLPADVLHAKVGELPCVREGRSIMLVKHLLVPRLLGYEP